MLNLPSHVEGELGVDTMSPRVFISYILFHFGANVINSHFETPGATDPWARIYAYKERVGLLNIPSPKVIIDFVSSKDHMAHRFTKLENFKYNLKLEKCYIIQINIM
ncbi:hypothetical protein ACJX0J_039882 [Zea mays]